MRKERLIGKERYAGYLQIFMQGLILALERELLEAGSGTNDLVMRDILFAFLAAQIFLNTAFFVIVAMKSLPQQVVS